MKRPPRPHQQLPEFQRSAVLPQLLVSPQKARLRPSLLPPLHLLLKRPCHPSKGRPGRRQQYPLDHPQIQDPLPYRSMQQHRIPLRLVPTSPGRLLRTRQTLAVAFPLWRLRLKPPGPPRGLWRPRHHSH
eukprot:scaffold3504_cov240-Pinguiococcus_pyrenoidosus.AAC.67